MIRSLRLSAHRARQEAEELCSHLTSSPGTSSTSSPSGSRSPSSSTRAPSSRRHRPRQGRKPLRPPDRTPRRRSSLPARERPRRPQALLVQRRAPLDDLVGLSHPPGPDAELPAQGLLRIDSRSSMPAVSASSRTATTCSSAARWTCSTSSCSSAAHGGLATAFLEARAHDVQHGWMADPLLHRLPDVHRRHDQQLRDLHRPAAERREALVPRLRPLGVLERRRSLRRRGAYRTQHLLVRPPRTTSSRS